MKRFIVVMLIIFMCTSLAACSDSYDKWDEEQIEAYGFIVIKQLGRYGESACYLVYDPATNIQYTVCTGSYSNFSLCPYYDEYGNVAIYKGE